MTEFVYIDETGSVGRGANRQRFLKLVAVVVPENQVQPLARAMQAIAIRHIEELPRKFEFHGQELWNGSKHWRGKEPEELLTAYTSVINLIEQMSLQIVHATIDKPALHRKYGGGADGNAYCLALQFLLEKINAMGPSSRIIIADESKEQELAAIRMVSDLQEWGAGEVPGTQPLTTIIDCLHFVRSENSPGVQMADMVAYILQRADYGYDQHPDVVAALNRMRGIIWAHTPTWRMAWPRA